MELCLRDRAGADSSERVRYFAGLTLSVSLWTFPTIYSVETLAPRDRLHLWSSTFDAGKVRSSLSSVCIISMTER